MMEIIDLKKCILILGTFAIIWICWHTIAIKSKLHEALVYAKFDDIHISKVGIFNHDYTGTKPYDYKGVKGRVVIRGTFYCNLYNYKCTYSLNVKDINHVQNRHTTESPVDGLLQSPGTGSTLPSPEPSLAFRTLR